VTKLSIRLSVPRGPRRPAAARRGAIAAAAGLAALAVLAGCGTAGNSAQSPGKPASVTLNLHTVPTVRSVTVSSSAKRFRHCVSGNPVNNTASTASELGFPNGLCWLGQEGAGGSGSYPITITNSGIATLIDINGGNAVPADGGVQWGLCNVGANPAVGCTSKDGKLPGANQYLLQNFSPAGQNATGLTGSPACDAMFGGSRHCWVQQNGSQSEGLRLTGPTVSHDTSTHWQITVTWMPAP